MSNCNDYECVGVEATQKGIQEQVKQERWGVVGVVDAPVPFCYTVGLHVKDKPELIMIGNIEPIHQAMMLNTAGTLALEANTKSDDIANMPVYILEVSDEYKEQYMGQAYNFYGNFDFRAFQLVWPDTAGLYPWEEGSEFAEGGQFYGKQPMLGIAP